MPAIVRIVDLVKNYYMGTQTVHVLKGLNLTYGVYDWGRSPSQRGVRPSDGFDVLTDDETIFVSDCFLPGMTDEERRASKTLVYPVVGLRLRRRTARPTEILEAY